MNLSHCLRHAPIVFVPLLLAGCLSAPTMQQTQSAYYGPPISRDDAMEKMKAFMVPRLKDPESTKYDCGEPHKDYIVHAVFFDGQTHYGYVMNCGVNSKNGFGGYTGMQPFAFLFRDNALIGAYQGLNPGVSGPAAPMQ